MNIFQALFRKVVNGLFVLKINIQESLKFVLMPRY